MTTTTQINDTQQALSQTLDLELIKPHLRELAIATVDKTLSQARQAKTDPVLKSSSALATYYLMMSRNDGQAQEAIIKSISRLVKGLTVINRDLRFGIHQGHLELIQSNPTDKIKEFEFEYAPNAGSSSYTPDALVINEIDNQACLLEFKRQVITVETSKLNKIADNLIISQTQVCDYLYKKHQRRTERPNVSWAIIDCSDQNLPERFGDAGVLGLDSLDAITGFKGVAKAYRLAREYIADEFCRGEAELMAECERYVPVQMVDVMIETAVSEAQEILASEGRLTSLPSTNKISDHAPETDSRENGLPDGNSHSERDTSIIKFPSNGQILRRHFGMFGT